MANNSGNFTVAYPMVKVFDYDDDNVVVYESKSNLVFLMSRAEYRVLTEYLMSADRQAFADGQKGQARLIATFDDMLALGMFVPGPWEKMFDATPENVDRLIDHNNANIFMRKYVLEITQDCNYRCSYCSNTLEKTWRHHRKRHMTFDVARKATDYYYRIYTGFLARVPEPYREAFIGHYPPTIGFYGGEPTLNWTVIEQTIEYFKSLPWAGHGIAVDKLKVTSNTNLSLLTDAMLRTLVDNDILLFASLDGPASEHDKNRLDAAGHPTFGRSYRNLMKIKEFDEEYFKKNVLVMAVEADNYDADAAHEFLDSLGCQISYLAMSHFGCFVHEPEKQLRWIEENEEKLVEARADRYDRDPEGSIADYTFVTSLRTDRPAMGNVANTLPTCPVATDNILVDVDGKLHICHKTDGSFPLGDVDNGLDREAMRDFHVRYAEMANQPQCRGCWSFRMCGQCAAVRLAGGKFRNPLKSECDYLRKSAETRFKSFVEIYRRHPSLLDDVKAYVGDLSRYKGVFDLSRIEWEKL